MKTHKLLKPLLLAVLITIAFPTFSAEIAPVKNNESPQEHAQRLERRLEEIRAMDVKQMSRTEKKALGKEVKAIKKEMKTMDGGLYISIGALILIAILLIILI